MSDSKEGPIDKAESLAKRVLERVGSKLDMKLFSGEEQAFGARYIGALASRLEQLTDSMLEQDDSGLRRVAPNRFRVLLTYEETSKLSPQYIDAMGTELTAMLFEYISNRRYMTRGPVRVETGTDLFANDPVMTASFDRGSARAPDKSSTALQPGAPPEGDEDSKAQRIVLLSGSDGQTYRIELEADGAAAYIGRAAGNALRIDDPSLSRLHCSLSCRSTGAVVIADLGSSNGTLVNHQSIGEGEARTLEAGDVIELGDFALTVSEIS